MKTIVAELPINGHSVKFHVECGTDADPIEVLSEIGWWAGELERQLRAEFKRPKPGLVVASVEVE